MIRLFGFREPWREIHSYNSPVDPLYGHNCARGGIPRQAKPHATLYASIPERTCRTIASPDTNGRIARSAVELPERRPFTPPIACGTATSHTSSFSPHPCGNGTPPLRPPYLRRPGPTQTAVRKRTWTDWIKRRRPRSKRCAAVTRLMVHQIVKSPRHGCDSPHGTCIWAGLIASNCCKASGPPTMTGGEWTGGCDDRGATTRQQDQGEHAGPSVG